MKEVKVVIGANYGDEGKGLMTRHFVQEAESIYDANPIVIFHNGTAQRGHTVDYNENFRHVFHHFGSGTGDKVPTFFAETFLIHPMEYVREYTELFNLGIRPQTYCDPRAKVITPFDMLVDHMTEAHIAKLNGAREFGSCGFGSWAATDRFPRCAYTITDFNNKEMYSTLMERIWCESLATLLERGVDFESLPEYTKYFVNNSEAKKNLIAHFWNDLQFFIHTTTIANFDTIWSKFNYTIFENGQGLGLDMNVDNDWHTTSNTGLANPIALLKGKTDYNGEACYVTRSYLTRHGDGPLEEAVKKSEINADMHDKTNVPNDFQGTLRYGFLEDADQAARIAKDWAFAKNNPLFKKSMAITHCNEFNDVRDNSKYFSNNPYNVEVRR